MTHQLSFIIYGGQPRKVLHCSRDVAEEERQAMMRWSRNLQVFGEYDEFISAGGISWIDVPTSTGRRLLVRVFATHGQSRDAWYFLGFVLSEDDYSAFSDYGEILSLIESFDVESLLSDRAVGSKMSVQAERDSETADRMPPLFQQDSDDTWTSADWVQSRAKTTQHLPGRELFIAFNPPAARSEYTALLLSDGFVKPGLKLKSKSQDSGDQNRSDEKKKASETVKTTLLLSLLLPAFVIGYLVSSSTRPNDSLLGTSIQTRDGNSLLPTIRLPRDIDSFDLLVDGRIADLEKLEVRSTVNWIEVGFPNSALAEGIKYHCTVEPDDDISANEVLLGSIKVLANGQVVSEYLVELEAVNMSVSILENPRLVLDDEAKLNSIGGYVYARLGIASVVVNDVSANVKTSPDGTVGEWRLDIDSWPEMIHVTVTDKKGNRVAKQKRQSLQPLKQNTHVEPR